MKQRYYGDITHHAMMVNGSMDVQEKASAYGPPLHTPRSGIVFIMTVNIEQRDIHTYLYNILTFHQSNELIVDNITTGESNSSHTRTHVPSFKCVLIACTTQTTSARLFRSILSSIDEGWKSQFSGVRTTLLTA